MPKEEKNAAPAPDTPQPVTNARLFELRDQVVYPYSLTPVPVTDENAAALAAAGLFADVKTEKFMNGSTECLRIENEFYSITVVPAYGGRIFQWKNKVSGVMFCDTNVSVFCRSDFRISFTVARISGFSSRRRLKNRLTFRKYTGRLLMML